VQDRRSAPRSSKAATGQIVVGSIVIDCAILDVSDRGARLEVSTTKTLPPNFVLKLTDGHRRDCKVVWQDEIAVGVEFC
jgi:PilZ domain